MSTITKKQTFNNVNFDAFILVHAGEVDAYAANLHVGTGQFPVTAWCSLQCG